MKSIYGLGIETSCDETGLALIEILEDRDKCFLSRLKILNNQIFSQIDFHSQFGGVVPEIASRAHLKKINILLEEITSYLKSKHKFSLSEIDFIAVSNRPGLIGSLIIGVQMAKVLSSLYKIPFIPINHLEAHLSVWAIDRLKKFPFSFPCIGLLISGGNTAIYDYKTFGDLKILGNTMDDAVGEAFDKVANILNLGYPGGIRIEKYASKFKKEKGEKNPLPKILPSQDQAQLNFSYSGIKTAVLRWVQSKRASWQKNSDPMEKDKQKICYYFQERCFELIIRNLEKAIRLLNYNHIVIGGGVSANLTLRNKINGLMKMIQSENNQKIYFYYPSELSFCTDNGAMIASLGYFYYKNKINGDLFTPVSSSV
jgi:N6-L-threonylcarbamoyladenine synthase